MFWRHDFVLGERVDEPIDPQWYRRHAECRRCGEKRLVYHAVPMDMLNAGECIQPPIKVKPWIGRLFW